jgi:hypothetical protein
MKADHGLYALKDAPMAELLDLAPWLGEVRVGLIQDMVDHEADMTEGQRIVLSEVLRSVFYVARIGKWLDGRPSLITAQGKPLPALEVRERLLSNVVKILDRLGTLDRRPPRVKSIPELIAELHQAEEPAGAVDHASNGPQ